MTEFLHMGGYAAYVWPSYGIATIVLLGLLVASWKGLRNAEATLKALESARPTRRRTRSEDPGVFTEVSALAAMPCNSLAVYHIILGEE